MPSSQKTLHFMSSGLMTAISVGLMGFAMSRQWVETTMTCRRGGIDTGNATIKLDLFNGMLSRNLCPQFGGVDEFEVIPVLSEEGGIPVVLHILLLCLLSLCLLFSAISILLCLYNSVSNPYQTYMGPIGVYTCSSLSACLSVVVLIIYVLNIYVTNMAEKLVVKFAESIIVELKDKSSEMKVGYYLIIPYTVLSLAAIAFIYAYDNAAYKHRQEQQRPTEDVPKEIMMY
ncbi:clarin-3 [Brachyistius frenatus]|uniref:clarin-3 n=1 Tax=Brachyistius frenatus TaxID=100188 RepID=UPI0037E79F49